MKNVFVKTVSVKHGLIVFQWSKKKSIMV